MPRFKLRCVHHCQWSVAVQWRCAHDRELRLGRRMWMYRHDKVEILDPTVKMK
jgi:hypothetical protein